MKTKETVTNVTGHTETELDAAANTVLGYWRSLPKPPSYEADADAYIHFLAEEGINGTFNILAALGFDTSNDELVIEILDRITSNAKSCENQEEAA